MKNRQEEIAALAYELYCNRGCHHGHELHDWLEAERIIAAKYLTIEAMTVSSRTPEKPKISVKTSAKKPLKEAAAAPEKAVAKKPAAKAAAAPQKTVVKKPAAKAAAPKRKKS